ncbi:sigma-70 family RNA polymerase sigma factor [Sphingomonas sp. KC8]|uniref:sigma-70 family RNA polymerase sigma factor n=1 Tax=Sphingomonas sp. KC8 TaxID=1030157 RepID=UPI00056B7C5F|nr:sigma-70 family RNA polymerase sigma factor [Sphingomonas sp. KC8]ARS25830.1 RNA polymerase sigma factor [Sphingomonas sp. KC8]
MRFQKRQSVLDHVPAMRRYARALSRDDDIADDIVQDALVRAYEGADTFRAGASLKNWLLAIVRNSFFGDLRRNKAENLRHERLALLLIDHVEAQQERQAYLRQIIDRFLMLSASQREVLHLISIEGLSYQEAAEVLDVPIGTVMSRISRARSALRALEIDAETKAAHQLYIVGGRDDA